MFTGIVEELGRVSALVLEPGSARLSVHADTVLGGVTHGASIAVNGVCLTVVQNDTDGFTVDVMPETLRLSSLGALHVGSAVNSSARCRRPDAWEAMSSKATSTQWAP